MNVRAAWYAQNEYVDPATCCLVHGSEAFEPEREALKAMGAPDTDSIHFYDVVPEDRDSSIVLADVTPALRSWMEHPNIDILVED